MGFEDKATAENVNEQDEHGNTRLHEAMNLGNKEEIASLMDLGANPDIENNDKVTARKMVVDSLEVIKGSFGETDMRLHNAIQNYSQACARNLSGWTEELEEERKIEGRENLTAGELQQEKIASYKLEIDEIRAIKEQGSLEEKRDNILVKATKREVQNRWNEILDTIGGSYKAGTEKARITTEIGKEMDAIEASVKARMEERKAARKAERLTLEQASTAGDQHVQSVDGNVKTTPGGSSPKSVANKEIY